MSLATIFMVVACVLFFCAAFNVPSSRVALGWLGAAFWALAALIGGIVLR